MLGVAVGEDRALGEQLLPYAGGTTAGEGTSSHLEKVPASISVERRLPLPAMVGSCVQECAWLAAKRLALRDDAHWLAAIFVPFGMLGGLVH